MIIYIVLGIIICILIYVVYNLTNKNTILQSMFENAEEKHVAVMSQVVDWMGIALTKLHNIDRLQIFEGDDDVGWFFQTLKFQITELNNQIANIIEQEGIEVVDEGEENAEKKK